MVNDLFRKFARLERLLLHLFTAPSLQGGVMKLFSEETEVSEVPMSKGLKVITVDRGIVAIFTLFFFIIHYYFYKKF